MHTFIFTIKEFKTLLCEKLGVTEERLNLISLVDLFMPIAKSFLKDEGISVTEKSTINIFWDREEHVFKITHA